MAGVNCDQRLKTGYHRVGAPRLARFDTFGEFHSYEANQLASGMFAPGLESRGTRATRLGHPPWVRHNLNLYVDTVLYASAAAITVLQ